MMNILRAKQEIIRTVKAYLAKYEDGQYLIPSVHQRPILLMGPPGIGKTAIMEQAASECGISLVSYTITHPPERYRSPLSDQTQVWQQRNDHYRIHYE